MGGRILIPVRKLRWVALLTLNICLAFGFPVTSHANLAGCPSSWNLQVEPKPDISFYPFWGADSLGYYFESSGNLEVAKKQFGRDIAYNFFAEWSQDGIQWFDLSSNLTNSRGFFTNSFETQPGLFVNLDQLFRYFQKGKWRVSLKVETKDCPQNYGFYSSAPLSLEFSIFDDKKYEVTELFLSKTPFNFKIIEEQIKDFENWKVKTLADLNSFGISKTVPDRPNSNYMVVASGGKPPCMNYIERNWRATSRDCFLEVFFVHRISATVLEYYLIDQLDINFVSNMKTKAEVEAKAKDSLKKRKITCVKDKKIKIVTSMNPKCPAGYKKKSMLK